MANIANRARDAITRNSGNMPQWTKGYQHVIIGSALGIGIGAATGNLRDELKYQLWSTPIWAMAPQAMYGKMFYDVATALGTAGAQAYQQASARWSESFDHNMKGNYFQDTQATHTMRQRAIHDMRLSRTNVHSALGKEASLMHQGAATPPYMRTRKMGW